jgi:hypothetical protein
LIRQARSLSTARSADAACLESTPRPVTVPQVTVIVIVLVLAAWLAVKGQPTASAFVVVAELVLTRLFRARPIAAVAGV